MDEITFLKNLKALRKAKFLFSKIQLGHTINFNSSAIKSIRNKTQLTEFGKPFEVSTGVVIAKNEKFIVVRDIERPWLKQTILLSDVLTKRIKFAFGGAGVVPIAK